MAVTELEEKANTPSDGDDSEARVVYGKGKRDLAARESFGGRGKQSWKIGRGWGKVKWHQP